jgi:hypothetical protein
MKTFFVKLYFAVLLLTANKPSAMEKLQYLCKLIITFAPVALALDAFEIWYQSNFQFFSFILCALSINMGVGIRYHIKMKTFSWKLFFTRNSEMFLVVIIVYALLEMLRNTAGNNLIGESFKVVIQLTTLLYPISKALKNIYILTQKKYPPAFIMERIYNFEKNGNVTDLFNQSTKNGSDNT